MTVPLPSNRALETMRKLGNFGPTANLSNREVKGYAKWGRDEEERVYLRSGDLRALAADIIEIAGWLDARAEAAS